MRTFRKIALVYICVLMMNACVSPLDNSPYEIHVSQDSKNAKELFNKAIFYMDGRYAAVDLKEAHFWMMKSAKQKLGIAQANIAINYQLGRAGLKVDMTECFAWASVAVVSKVDSEWAKELVQECFTNIPIGKQAIAKARAQHLIEQYGNKNS